jgi:hypothetical protein
MTLFDCIAWRDPVTGRRLEPRVTARTPAGVPICGALVVSGTSVAYPIVDCVARLTPELAQRYASWLEPMGLRPPAASDVSFQPDQRYIAAEEFWTYFARPGLNAVRREAGLVVARKLATVR